MIVFRNIVVAQGRVDDPSTRSPNRFLIEMRLGMKWLIGYLDDGYIGGSKSVERWNVEKHQHLLVVMLRMNGRGV